MRRHIVREATKVREAFVRDFVRVFCAGDFVEKE
jgi:hypothetical protein